MTSRAGQISDRVEQVLNLVRERFEGRPGIAALEGFARVYFSRVAPEDIVGHTVENLYGALLSLWKFAERRKPGQLKLRLFRPRVDQEGWSCPHAVIEIVNDDMPFLVDSVTMTLGQLGLSVHLLLHPIIGVTRDAEGRRTEQGSTAGSESLMHIEIADPGDPETVAEIERQLRGCLEDVRHAVDDWRAMLGRLEDVMADLERSPPPLDADEVTEAKALLRWMGDNHFTFLGCRDYDYSDADAMRIIEGSGLGILRDPSRRVMIGQDGFTANLPATRDFLQRKELLIITKANSRATVHRPVPLDYIGVRRFGADGRVLGERRFVGLFTSAAYNRNPREIPVLRRKVSRVLSQAGLDPRSHDGKAMLNLVETYPRDELFQITEADLHDTINGILQVQLRPRLRLFMRRDQFGRFFSCLVYVPRERYDTGLRRRFEQILAQALQGRVANFHTQLGDDLLARIHFIVQVPPDIALRPDVEAIEARMAEAMRAWTDALQETLIEESGEADGLRLFRRYGQSFPVGYQEAYDVRVATADIAKMERLGPSLALGVNLYRPLEAAENELRFKMYRAGHPVPLSDCMPMLEHMGLKVEAEHPFEIAAQGERPSVHIHDFVLHAPPGVEFNLDDLKPRFETAFSEVWRGRMEDDGFNRLVLLAGLDWREVTALRTLARYLRQIGTAFSQTYMEDTLAGNPAIARRLVEFFHARFDPRLTEDRPRLMEGLRGGVLQALDQVASLDEDRILRRFLNLIEAALRTNFYQRDTEGEPKAQLSVKFDCAAIEELPLPRPYREIFVYSPRVEGVHLRGGKVARGGLRWSDRREDFRTEVLGLMKAQMVKNAVIVPVGAKGGFVPKRPPLEGGREAVQADGVECYRSFLRGLLDITDNRAGGAVVAPADVVRHDEDDPYLVVAADKGTATFSDIANALSAEYGFWLGDAFASGGSAGYDHKKMGITARGAWETVKRHFRELGKDIMREEFTVAGIGDMSGDVFGNGMLLSPHIRLLAAFDHRHIFIDPAPDAARGFAERRRLFDLPRSSWADYAPEAISPGGGVFDRKAKSIRLSPQMKALFGLERDSLTPAELMRAILTLDVDLLWNGGIGTYVKASDESHAEVGDRANDSIRVDGRGLRARVVGEGGNLGFTQRGRIEFALAGGRINTDAVDNSAGVDCSDHEVNIKILLNAIVADGDLTPKQRDQILAEMTEEVGELVLRDNYLQGQAISVMQASGAALVPAAQRFIRTLERQNRLDRAIEFLPADTALDARHKAGIGLTRPELAVLLAYAKTTLYSDLLESDLPDDPYFTGELPKYFPRPLRRRFARQIARHDLRREIVTTAIANSIVNRVSVDFVSDIAEETQAGPAEVARAYALAREVFELRRLWTEIEALDSRVPADCQTAMQLATIRLIRRATLWFLRHSSGPIAIAAMADTYAEAIAALARIVDEALAAPARARLEAEVERFTGPGVPEPLARSVARLDPLGAAPDIVDAARATGRPLEQVARCYFALGERLGFDWLRETALTQPLTDYWQRLAVTAMVDELDATQRELVQVVVAGADGAPAEEAVGQWETRQGNALARLRHLIDEFRVAGLMDAARLAIANRQARALVRRDQ
ncbi:MAG: NAD-glutamate dehydrogenase [Alphaproteobacteria bacterium]|nr:NAD-glutamate dehydrogenase [Alphaproteobacteria bacterium]